MLSILERWWEFQKKYNKYGKQWNDAKYIVHRNRKENKELSALIYELIDTKTLIKSKNDSYWCVAEFDCGTKIRFWISNKMYAYGQDFVINGKSYDGMPSRFVNQMLLDFVENKA